MSKKNSNTNTISLSATITASSSGGNGTGSDGGAGNKKLKADGSSSSSSNDQQPKKPRTIQVKIGNHAAKEMTPDQAADYLRLLATAGAAAAATAGGGSGNSSGGRSGGSGGTMMPQQVKMTFQNGTTETVPLTTGGGGGGGTAVSMSISSTSVGGSNLFRSSKSSKKGGGSASNSSDVNNINNMNGGVNNMPCTEKEMKALMSMFVEIMGLQMNTDKLNKQQYKGGKKKKKTDATDNAADAADGDQKMPGEGDDSMAVPARPKDKKKLFHFPAGLPPPPGGWPQDLLWPNGCASKSDKKKKTKSHENGNADDNNEEEEDNEYESSSDDEYADDDSLEELSSLPDLEDIPPDVRQKAATAAATAALTTRTAAMAEAVAQRNGSNSSATNAATSANTLLARKTGLVAGIAVPEWEALERVAMEEALEQEERARKSSKAAASSNSTAASLSTSFLRSTVMEALTTSSSSSSSSAAVAAAAAAAACASSGVTPTAASRAALAAANSQAAAARAAAQATAALKRRAKAAQVWRTKVIAACQSCDTPTLDRLLKEDSDLRKQLEKQEKESSNTTTNSANNNNNSTSNLSSLPSPACNDVDPSASSATFDALLPYCLPNTKNHRASLIKTRETRQRLARHLLSICPSRLAKQPLRNNGRTVLHMACMYGDYPLVKQILQANNISNTNSSNNNATAPANKNNNSKKPPLPTSCSTANTSNTIHDNGLDFPCQDSGWTPLHYAALSGSMQTMELLLSKGANLSAVTDDIHTWWSSTSKGLTPKQLVDVVASGKVEKQVETHGMALSEITKEFLNTSSDTGAGVDEATTTAATTTETRKYLAWLQRISQRLAALERAKKNNSSNQYYYTEPSKKELCDWSQEKVQEPTVAASAAAATSTNTNNSSSATTIPVVVAVDETTKTKAPVQGKAASKAAPAPMSSSESLPNKTKDDSSESESGTDRPMFAPSSTASSNIPNESKKRIKKKKKKDGSADSNNAIYSVTESAPFSANSAVFTAAEDPLVTALKGMGFAEKQILAGIQACGGANRATPDMIVAWIFEQESSGGGGSLDGHAATPRSGGVVSNKKETPTEFTQQKKRGNETKISSNNKPSSSTSSSVSSSQHQQEKPGSSTVAAAGTKKSKEAKQREQDLAAKREEQRRRNREWNKKQEAQHVEVVVRSSVVSSNSATSVTNTRAPSPTPALMTGLPAVTATATSSTAAALVSSAAPTSTSSKQPPPGLASMPQTASMSTMPAVEITTDASTIASSVGDFLNDDATISTIGSRTTNTQHSILQTFSNSGGNSAVVGLPYPQHLHHHHQQALHPQSQQQHMPVAPPGFGPSVAAVPESVPVADENWHQASLGLGQRLYAPPGSSMAPPPPGIAGSRPFVDQRAQASSLTAASMGSLQSRMSAAHEAFAGSFSARAPNVPPQQHLSSSSIRGVSVGSSGFGSSSLFGLPPPAPVLHHHQSMSSISDPSFAATSSSTVGSHSAMDPSSLIESMATGNAPIGGASLWGGHDQHHVRSTAGSSLLDGPPAHSGGSSLLGNLIQTNQARQVDSLFSFDNQTSSLSGWGDNTPNNTNFGSNRGIGGHPVGDGTSNQRGNHGNIW